MRPLLRRKRLRFGTPRPGPLRCPSHLAWVRGHVCAVPGCISPDIEAAHVRTGTDGGLSSKPSDCWAIPLCSTHHRLQHLIGERQFQGSHGIDLKEIAVDLWRRSHHRQREAG